MIKTVSIIGMGALGLLYANQIKSANGFDAVDFIMDEERIKKYEAQDFYINAQPHRFKLTSVEAAQPVDLLIVAVKYGALSSIYNIIDKCCDEHTIVMSVMNGISSEDLIKANCKCKNVIYTVAQGMDAMKAGNELKYTKMGELHIGVFDEKDQQALTDVVDYFESINMPYEKEDDILYRLWFKYMLNVGINQTCMIDEVGYGIATTPGNDSYKMLVSAMREVEVIAIAKGINLSEKDINTAISIIRTLDLEGRPSMAQDRMAKRYSEVDMFAGTVIELGKELGILVPVNEYIYKQVKLIEAEY